MLLQNKKTDSVTIPWKFILILISAQVLTGYFWYKKLFNNMPMLFWDAAAYDYENLLLFNKIGIDGIKAGFDLLIDLTAIGRPILSSLVFTFIGKGNISGYVVNGIYLLALYSGVALISEKISENSSKISLLILSITPSVYLYGTRVEQIHFSAFTLMFLSYAILYITPLNKLSFSAPIILCFGLFTKPVQGFVLLPFVYSLLLYRAFLKNEFKKFYWSNLKEIFVFSLVVLVVAGPYLGIKFYRLYSYFSTVLTHENHMGLKGIGWITWYFKNYFVDHLGLAGLFSILLTFCLIKFSKNKVKIVYPKAVFIWILILPIVTIFESRAGVLSIAAIPIIPIFLGVNLNNTLTNKKNIIYLLAFIFLLNQFYWGSRPYDKDIDGKNWYVSELAKIIESDFEKRELSNTVVSVIAANEVINTSTINGLLSRRNNRIFYNKLQIEEPTILATVDGLMNRIRKSNYVITKSSNTSPSHLGKELIYTSVYKKILENNLYNELWVSPILPDNSIVRLYYIGNNNECIIRGMTEDGWVNKEVFFLCLGTFNKSLNLEISANNLSEKKDIDVEIEIVDIVSNQTILNLNFNKSGEFNQTITLPLSKNLDPFYKIKIKKGLKNLNGDTREIALHQLKIKKIQ